MPLQRILFHAQRVRRTLLIVMLFGLPGLIYLNILDSPFVFDDSRIYNNPSIRLSDLSIKNLLQAAFVSAPASRPVANLSFALNYYFFQYQVVGYHLTNIFVHCLAGICLFFLFDTTLALPVCRKRYGALPWVPWIAALIWAVHPIQTQAVTYIVQRMTSMAALFYLLSLLSYVKARQALCRRWSVLLFGMCLASALLALGSKETAATLPFFIFLYEWYFLQDLRLAWLQRNFIYPFLVVVALLILALIYLDFSPWQALVAGYQYRPFTMGERLLTEFRVVLFYVSLLLFPHPNRLNLDHDFQISTSLFAPLATAGAILAVLSFMGLAFYLARRQRLLSFAIIWYFGNLFIESSFLNLDLVNEHRLYLPSMMLILLAVVTVARFAADRGYLFKAGMGFLLIVTLAFWTYQRNLVWQDPISLWSDCVRKAPENARSHNNLAVALKKNGRLDEAEYHYRETIRIDPGFTEAYNNLGNIMMLRGRMKEALHYYYEAVQRFPNSPLLHVNLGNALEQENRLAEAIFHYSLAVRLQPDDTLASANLRRAQRLLASRRQEGGGAP